ncbi:MAG: hypothetical protein ABSB97_08535 [Thermoplasmata archaeon]|jgi:hypothetical protein
MLDPLSLALLIAELVLLMATLYLLLMARREAGARKRLLSQMARTAAVLSRQEYFHSVILGMQTARSSIHGLISGSSPTTKENADHVRQIAEQIQLAVQRGTTVRYLVPKAVDRIALASLYRAAGADLRFHPGHLVNDARYVIFDDRFTVIGLPAVTGENEPTREGFTLPSEGVASIFDQQFDQDWSGATPYDAYLTEVIQEIRFHSPQVSLRLISTQLQISEKELLQYESNRPASGPLEGLS